jgi:hypothetical protein
LEVHVKGRLVVNSVTVRLPCRRRRPWAHPNAAHLHRNGSCRGQTCDRSQPMGTNSGDRIFSLLSEPPPDAASAQGLGRSATARPGRLAISRRRDAMILRYWKLSGSKCTFQETAIGTRITCSSAGMSLIGTSPTCRDLHDKSAIGAVKRTRRGIRPVQEKLHSATSRRRGDSACPRL